MIFFLKFGSFFVKYYQEFCLWMFLQKNLTHLVRFWGCVFKWYFCSITVSSKYFRLINYPVQPGMGFSALFPSNICSIFYVFLLRSKSINFATELYFNRIKYYIKYRGKNGLWYYSSSLKLKMINEKFLFFLKNLQFSPENELPLPSKFSSMTSNWQSKGLLFIN